MRIEYIDRLERESGRFAVGSFGNVDVDSLCGCILDEFGKFTGSAAWLEKTRQEVPEQMVLIGREVGEKVISKRNISGSDISILIGYSRKKKEIEKTFYVCSENKGFDFEGFHSYLDQKVDLTNRSYSLD